MFPYCRYYVDPDATAYLTIARRYATGDWVRGVNGYWSPLSCWFTAMGICAGMEAITAAVVVNTAGALGFLGVSFSLFRYFGLKQYVQWLFCAALTVFLAYAVYYQLFADLWECFLLLAGLRIVLSERFLRAPALWILHGCVGALAYFSKAYAFPFFLLNTLVCVFFLAGKNKLQWLKICVVSIGVMMVCASPWIWLLHEKYGRWMTSTAGSLNMSWYLLGHANYKPGLGCLLPLPYADAVYHWEDPYYVAGDTPHFWSSGHYFLLQCARVVQNFLKMAGSMSALSLFFFPLWIAAFLVFSIKKRRQHLPRPLQMLLISFLLFPLAFLLINFEPRYIWYLVPPGMILGHFALQQLKKRQKAATVVFALSFALWPLLDTAFIWNEGKREFEQAKEMKKKNIKGSFTANTGNNRDIQKMVRLAYFSGNSCYVAPLAGRTTEQVLQEMRRYHIKYYFQSDDMRGVTVSEKSLPFPNVAYINGLGVFLVNP